MAEVLILRSTGQYSTQDKTTSLQRYSTSNKKQKQIAVSTKSFKYVAAEAGRPQLLAINATDVHETKETAERATNKK